MSSATKVRIHPQVCALCGSEGSETLFTRFDSNQVVRCRSCDHCFVSPMPALERLNQIYSWYFKDDPDVIVSRLTAWFNSEETPYQKTLKYLDANFDWKGKRVLDLGCSVGLFLNAAKKRGADPVGLEPGMICRELAKKHFGVDIEPLSLEEAIEKKPFPDGAFDLVTAFETIEHLANPEELVLAMKNWLAPGGLGVISTPNFSSYEKWGEKSPIFLQHEEHLHYFHRRTLFGLVERHGLTPMVFLGVGVHQPSDVIKQRINGATLSREAWRFLRRIPGVLKVKDLLLSNADRTGGSDTRLESEFLDFVCVFRN